MTGWQTGRRPITLAILAMGGEGGGVLSDWVVAVADQAGWTAQNTSVAGVAQRTGATVYYVELYPPEPDGVPAGGRPEPVLSLFPTPGEVDIVIASELMEAGRAIQRGFCTPDRTTLIASTNRVYSVTEKIKLGDGRVDSDTLLAAAVAAAKQLISADFSALAREAGSVISASLFGALAGSGALPFERERFEDAVRASGKGVEASLRAFAAGFEAARTPPAAPARTGRPVDVTIGRRPVSPEELKQAEERRRNEIAATDPAALVGPGLRRQAQRVGREFPAAARSMMLHGLVRTAVYQDPAYADRYLDRVARFAAVDADSAGAARLTRTAARHLALWMCYQDTIHVALQKARRARLDLVRAEGRGGTRSDRAGTRVPGPARRRDRRHAADRPGPPARGLAAVPFGRRPDRRARPGGDHHLGPRVHHADHGGQAAAVAAAIAAVRPRATGHRGLDGAGLASRRERPGTGR